MRLLKQYYRDILVFSSTIVVFILSRLLHIVSLPIFTDEAIYIRWTQIANADAAQRFISLTDGKQPSFIWLAMLSMRFISDPLLATRLVSVFAGILTLIALFLIGRELFSKRVGFIAMVIYILYPFALVYDRMALYDSLVGATFVWALYMEILLVKYVRLDIALLTGVVIGIGMLTKTNAFFSLPLFAVSLLLFDFKKKDWKKLFMLWLLYVVVAIVVSQSMYAILRLSPFFHIINEKTALFAYPIREWLMHPFEYFISNLRGLFDWLVIYLSWPLLLFSVSSFLTLRTTISAKNVKLMTILFTICSLVVGVITIVSSFFATTIVHVLASGNFDKELWFNNKEITSGVFPLASLLVILAIVAFGIYIKSNEWKKKLLLFVWFVVPFVYLAFFGRTIYPRFIFLMTLPLLLLIAYMFNAIYESLKNRVVVYTIALAFLILPLWADYQIYFDFKNAPIPEIDLAQLINSWPAGGGVKESVAFLEEESKKGHLTVVTQGTFGLMPYSLEIYLVQNKNIKIEGLWPIDGTMPQKYVQLAKKEPVYLIFYQPCPACSHKYEAPVSWPVTLLKTYPKGNSDAALFLYKVRN